MRRNKVRSEEIFLQIKLLYEEGKTYKQICDALDICPTWIQECREQYNLHSAYYIKYSPEFLESVKQDTEAGYNNETIAEKHGVSPSSIAKFKKKHGIISEKKPSPRLSNAQKKQLLSLYYNLDYKLTEVTAMIGFPHKDLAYYQKLYKLPRRPYKKRILAGERIRDFIRMYNNPTLNTQEIADHFGMSYPSVCINGKEFGLEKRSVIKAVHREKVKKCGILR